MYLQMKTKEGHLKQKGKRCFGEEREKARHRAILLAQLLVLCDPCAMARPKWRTQKERSADTAAPTTK